ncbi:MAG: hypothetical protein KKD59_02660 [Acidobacteria bacterium]|nr:hypothetical protein [Acidobacteriota bacterium]MBU4330721.1 hypothetical protein [Acidobacteriota bacterium]
MSLTLNQLLFVVLTIAAVVAVTSLVFLFAQLRRTAREGEQALSEIRSLIENLKRTNEAVQEKLEHADGVILGTQKFVDGMGDMTQMVLTKLIMPSSKYWPFLAPLARTAWRLYKKDKNKRRSDNGK